LAAAKPVFQGQFWRATGMRRIFVFAPLNIPEFSPVRAAATLRDNGSLLGFLKVGAQKLKCAA